MNSFLEDAEYILQNGPNNLRKVFDAGRRLARFVLRLTDIRTTYEGRDGYALVDKAQWEALLAENALLKEQLTPSTQHH